MLIKLNTTKETFERALYKNGYNIKINLFEQFIFNLKRVISFNLNKGIEVDKFKEVLIDIFGKINIDKLTPLIISDKEEIKFISIAYLINLLDEGLFDAFVENRVDKEIKEEDIQIFYKYYIYSKLQNKSNYNFKLKKINSKAYYTFIKNISKYISQINKEEIEKKVIDEFVRDIKYYHLSAHYFSNINILGQNLSTDDFDNYLRKILINYNMFENGIDTISFENDYRLIDIDNRINRLINNVIYIKKTDVLELIYLINSNGEYRDKQSFKMIETSNNNIKTSNNNIKTLFHIADDVLHFNFDAEFNSFNINDIKNSFSIQDMINYKQLQEGDV